MKIEICGYIQPFSSLKQGDVFKYNDMIYLKTNEIVSDYSDCNQTYNCVELENGTLCCILKTTLVEPLNNAVLKIGHKYESGGSV